MKFEIFSREEVQQYESSIPHVNISIHGTNQPKAILSQNDLGRHATLFIEYDDIDKLIPGYQLFTREDAKKIISFFNEWKDKVGMFVINCEAGIARSSATAAALAIINRQSDSFVFRSDYYRPNMFVYRTILNEWNK